ncbi:amino acid permease [Peribacillus sp. V2I11]|nr:amino acid permease [Peribacillus sp. V2I11]
MIFIILGAATMVGFIPMTNSQPAPFFSNFISTGLFPNGAFAIIMTMLAVNFAFSGTELIGIAAGETVDPEKTIPKAIRITLWRLIIFFVGTSLYYLGYCLSRMQEY